MTRLSKREGEVLKLAAQGHTDGGIARELQISVATVRGYWLRIRTKLGGTGRSELVGQWVAQNARTASDSLASEQSEHAQVKLDAIRHLLDAERSELDKLIASATPAQRDLLQKVRQSFDDELDRQGNPEPSES